MQRVELLYFNIHINLAKTITRVVTVNHTQKCKIDTHCGTPTDSTRKFLLCIANTQ
jgi:hypothetical protein